MSKTLQWMFIMVVGGILGLFVGQLLANLAPEGFLKDLLTRDVAFGLEPPGTLDLRFLTLTVGAQVRMTLLGFLGLILAFYFGRRL